MAYPTHPPFCLLNTWMVPNLYSTCTIFIPSRLRTPFEFKPYIIIGFPINSTFLEKWNEEIEAVGSSVAGTLKKKNQNQPNDIFSMETSNILTIVWYPKSIEFGLSLSSVGGGTTGALLLPAALLVLQPLGEVIT